MNAVVLGEPGTGKTMSLLTLEPWLVKTNTKCLVIDCDGKISGIQQFNKPCFVIVDLGLRLIEQGLQAKIRNIKSPPSTEPKGYMKLAAAIDQAAAKYKEENISVRVMDTFTTAADHLRAFLEHFARKTQFEFAEWGLFKKNLQFLVGDFFAIGNGSGLNIINMHTQLEKNELTGEVKLLPYVDGSFRNEVGFYPTELFLAFAKESGPTSPPKYMWRVRPSAKITCRTTMFPENVVEAPQDWGPVFTAAWQQ